MGAALGIETDVPMEPEEMARDVTVTFFPERDQETTPEVRAFTAELREALEALGVEVRPFEETLTPLPRGRAARWYAGATLNTLLRPVRRLLGKTPENAPGLGVMRHVRLGEKVERGTSIVAPGEGEAGNLPVDHSSSFRETTIVTVLPWPEGIDGDATFLEHFDKAMELFSYHMTNVVLGVAGDRWLLYNFNGAHPIFDRDGDLEEQVLPTLVPKIAAPIRPPRLREFEVEAGAFDPADDTHGPPIRDLVESGALLEETDLYPPGKDLDKLPWRNDFYRWVGKLHLDDRSGMSYGFLARQLPTDLPPALPRDEAGDRYGSDALGDVVDAGDDVVVRLDLPGGPRWIPVPPVEVMTIRSGADKTNPDPEADLVKLALEAGGMRLETPEGVAVGEGFRPSFDTRVILAHAVGNAVVGSALAEDQPDHPLVRGLEEEGMGLVHWHGYLDPDRIPAGWHVHGAREPHVSCGTPQAALYALRGKLEAFAAAREAGAKFLGDVHLEPQHGTNLTFPTLQEAGEFLSRSEDVAGLGNEHLERYKVGDI